MFNYTEGEINAGFDYYVAYRAEKNSNTTEVDVPFCNGGFKCAILNISGISRRFRPFGMLMRDYGGHGRNTRTFCAAHV